MDIIVSLTKTLRALLHSCSCGGIVTPARIKCLTSCGKRKAYLYSTNKVNLSTTKFKEVRHMEESQHVKKLENLRFIVLLADKDSPTGLKEKIFLT